MVRAIQLEKPPIVEEIPDDVLEDELRQVEDQIIAEEVEETEVAAVSADIDPNTDYSSADFDASSASRRLLNIVKNRDGAKFTEDLVSGVSYDYGVILTSSLTNWPTVATAASSLLGRRKEIEPKKTYLPQPTGKRIIILK